MSIKIGNIDISYFKVGGADCSIYIGDVKMYPTTPPTPSSPKYVLTLSDSSTVSAECDGTSAITQAEISAYTSTLTSAEIGNCVTTIDASAFINCYSLTSIEIPNSVTSIGDAAFRYCTSLTSIDIPSGVTSINYSTFGYCSGLTSVTIPDSVTSIGDSVFRNCTSLTSITIPDSVTSIASAFRNCTSLTSVNIGTGITSVGMMAFGYCTGLATVTCLATNPPTLDTSSFQNTSSNLIIYVPAESVETYKAALGWRNYADRIQAIPTPTFDNIIEYTASSKLSETTTSSSAGLHTYAFSGTSGELTITSHTFSNGVGTIVFNGDVKRVGTYAFFRCSGATSITIPSSVSVFDTQPFWGCTSLTDITIKATVAPTFDGLVFDNTHNCNINVPCESLVDYASDSMFYTYGWVSRLKGISPCTNKVRYNDSGTTCHDYDLYQVGALQLSTDNGSTWSYVSPVVTQEYLLEENSQSCGYVPPTPHGNEYFTTVALQWGNIDFTSDDNTLEYSTDAGSTWQTGNSVSVNEGDEILWRCNNSMVNYGIGIFSSDCPFEVQGNIMSLLFGDNFSGQTDLTGYDNAFASLFSNCSEITSAENLALPATTLANNCYQQMFNGCTSLRTAPELPATTLADFCYSNMFEGCTSLIIAPELPATTLAQGCYSNMFNGCTSLMAAPELPATTLESECYDGMFNGCTSLMTAPSELPATTLADYCYNYMFGACTSLTEVPELPATTLADGCYATMFNSCTSLMVAPVLSATTLADYCYDGMFGGCTSLTTAPVLSATTLAQGCYSNMFGGCSSLTAITCLATDISAMDCTSYWVSGVAASGTFTKDANMNDWQTCDDSGIPCDWTVQDYQP